MGSRCRRVILWAAFLGAIAPDLDLFYFYLVDHRQTHHHLYWSHFPLLWLTVFCLIYCLHRVWDRKHLTFPGLVFCGSGVVHMLLDSLVGDICWLAPFSYEPFSLFTVPGGYHPWWLNFILHWSFFFEVVITGWAFWCWKYGGGVRWIWGRKALIRSKS